MILAQGNVIYPETNNSELVVRCDDNGVFAFSGPDCAQEKGIQGLVAETRNITGWPGAFIVSHDPMGGVALRSF